LRTRVIEYLQELTVHMAFLKEYIAPETGPDCSEQDMGRGRSSDLRASAINSDIDITKL